ncbi:hypothetical protein HDU96_002652 [Phlyctochytrium bullatum]|nr:hypothetical protein HDU96_002652 [Phlyctochytrium bullatum]
MAVDPPKQSDREQKASDEMEEDEDEDEEDGEDGAGEDEEAEEPPVDYPHKKRRKTKKEREDERREKTLAEVLLIMDEYAPIVSSKKPGIGGVAVMAMLVTSSARWGSHVDTTDFA